MNDITHKQITLRSAEAVAIVFCKPETIELIKNNKIPKGNIFEFARAAGFLGAKNTQHLLPHCHPVNIDNMDFEFEFINYESNSDIIKVPERAGILITTLAKSIGRTGIEMEALTGISVAALEIYDMLKPVDDSLEIGGIKLLNKKGGKSDRKKSFAKNSTCAVLVLSDSAFNGSRKDKSGQLIKNILEKEGANIIDFKILPDEKDKIKEQLLIWVNEGLNFIFTTGGTGLSPRDVTVEAVNEIIEKEANGISEAMRVYGQMRTPFAMMSRAVAGSLKKTLIITLPGSPKGVEESLAAILPALFHAKLMLDEQGH